jgi:leucyl-tRNA synthetase
MPSDSGESPLAKAKDWVEVECPKCKGKAERETDVMPNWAGSSWYFLRYVDPKNTEVLADKGKIKKWMPVDWYNGGTEHTTLHLLYSRFWHKFLFDIGVVNTKEPYIKRTFHGFILGEDNEKMSKSRNNVVNPNDVIDKYGADTLRLYEMFMGPFNQAIAWSTDGLMGPRRFLDRVWRLSEKVKDVKSNFETLRHQTIRKVSDDVEEMRFNTAISAMMVYLNELEKTEEISQEDFLSLLSLLAPFAPHITEELWNKLEKNNSIHLTPWPAYDKNKVVEKRHLVVIQVNGKVRGELEVGEESEEEITEKAVLIETVRKHLEGKKIKKTIYVKNKILNIVL